MILTRKDITDVAEIDDVKDMFKFDEVIGIEILKTDSQPGIKIFSYYNPPLSTPNNDILKYISLLRGNCILTGDLNCKNTLWGSSKNEARGIQLLDALNSFNLVTFNDDSQTRCDPVSGKEESLDLVVGNLMSARIFKEFWVGYDIGSDHYPVHATLQFKAPSLASPLKTRKAQKLNRTKWNKILNSHQPAPKASTAADLENNAVNITNQIKDAFEQCCPLTIIRKRPKCRFSPEISAKVKEKRKLRREKNNALHSQNYELVRVLMSRINKIGNDIKKLQKFEQKQELERHCQNLNKESNSKKFFETFRLISRPELKEQSSTTPRPLEDELGNKATLSKDKAHLFANRLQRIHSEPDFAGFSNIWKETVEKKIADHERTFKEKLDEKYDELEPGDDSTLCQEIDLDEFETNLAKCKNRSAVGHDGISYFLLKKLPKKTKESLCRIYSDTIRLGYFPKLWKVAIVKMIPKPNKDVKYAKSFRPISLLSCIGKLLERILASRLSKYMEEKKLFSLSQSGFRRHHMTTEQLLRLSEESHRAFEKRQTVAAVFLDAEAAFDKCWHNGIRYKLKFSLNLPDRIVRLLNSFLTDRVLSVIHEGHQSHQVKLGAGTPQGSPLSPLIYIIFVNDYPDSIKDKCSLSQFADDTALWAAAHTRAHAIRTLQKSLDELEGWCRRWRVKLNGDKSNLIFISRARVDDKENHALQLFNDTIRPVNNAKFLGVEFDSALSFKKHIDSIQSRSTTRLNVLKVLARNGVDSKTLIKLYKIYVRPITEYGSAAFVATTTTQLDRLKRIQNEAIRVCLKLPRYIRTDLLHEYASLEPITDRLLAMNHSLLSRMKTHNADVETLCDSISNVAHKKLKSPIALITGYKN